MSAEIDKASKEKRLDDNTRGGQQQRDEQHQRAHATVRAEQRKQMTERFNGGLPQRRHHFTRQRALPFIAFALGAESGNTNHHRAAYHHELVARFRCQTHSDWNHHDMQRYRKHLKVLARRHHVPIGPPPAWVDPRC